MFNLRSLYYFLDKHTFTRVGQTAQLLRGINPKKHPKTCPSADVLPSWTRHKIGFQDGNKWIICYLYESEDSFLLNILRYAVLKLRVVENTSSQLKYPFTSCLAWFSWKYFWSKNNFMRKKINFYLIKYCLYITL